MSTVQIFTVVTTVSTKTLLFTVNKNNTLYIPLLYSMFHIYLSLYKIKLTVPANTYSNFFKEQMLFKILTKSP